jgi:hypothetical protein
MQGGISWRRSRFSIHNGACVEVASVTDGIVVRDSVDPDGPVLRCSGQAWRAFTMVTSGAMIAPHTFVR